MVVPPPCARGALLARRTMIFTAALSTCAPQLPANAASGRAVDLVAQISGSLSADARALQYYVRETAPDSRANNYAPVRARVARERKRLQQLVSSM
eukprot:2710913-Prymnesium_polylepis.1